jgi:hypothetical protein
MLVSSCSNAAAWLLWPTAAGLTLRLLLLQAAVAAAPMDALAAAAAAAMPASLHQEDLHV